jgi:hypothetical protein
VETIDNLNNTTTVIEVDPEFERVALVEPPRKRGRGPTVQYRSMVDPKSFDNIIEAIGATTVDGIVFSHIFSSGPCTEKGIRVARNLKQKAVESALHRLKGMTVIRAEPLTQAATTEASPVSEAADNDVEVIVIT